MKNRTKEILLELGLVSEDGIETIASSVRDRDDISVLRDKNSGRIFLDRSDYMDIQHYADIETGIYWGSASREEALKKYDMDDSRRFEQFKSYITNRSVIDIGCGTGGFLDYAKQVSSKVAGVEPQNMVRKELSDIGYEMYASADQVTSGSFEAATLFHTLEHLTEPLETLEEIRQLLSPGGTLIVEVPHANDALLQLPSFSRFSFWSEHLILHTKESLESFLKSAGFKDIEVQGYQRYPVSNHLYWLLDSKPGGQKIHPELDEINVLYEKLLIEKNKTDTLIAIARV